MDTPLDLARAVAASAGWEPLVRVLIGLTVVAAAGHLALGLAARASAARRHLVAVATLAAMLGLPLAATVAPRWELPVLPAGPGVIATPDPLAPLAAAAASAGDALPRATSSGVPAREAGFRLAAAPAPAAAPAGPTPRSWPAVTLLTVAGVAGILLAGVAFALLAAASLVARSARMTDAVLLAELERAARRLGVAGAVELRRREGHGVPMVTGLARPTLLLPADAAAWPADRLRAVLLHELAHVRRRDAATMLLGRIATAALWFHPLAWTLARVARRECERACDDLVLASGMRPSCYAEHLLWVARRAFGDPAPAFAMSFARPSSLESRLRAILSTGAPRGGVSRRGVLVTLGATLLVVAPLASVRVVAAPARDARVAEVELEVTATGGAVELGLVRTARPEPATRTAPAAPKAAATTPVTTEPVPDAMPVWVNANDESPAPGPEIVLAQASRRDFDAGGDRAGRGSGESWFGRAREHYDHRRWVSAAEAFHRAAAAGYRRGAAFYNAGCSYALAGRLDEALDALEAARAAGFDLDHYLRTDDDLDALRDEPRFDELIEASRRTSKQERRRRSSQDAYETARRAGEQDPGAWHSAGITLMRAGDHARAVRAFERQIAIAPEPNAWYNLACALALAGEDARALDELERAVRAGYSNPGHMREDEDLRALRKHDRFDELVALAGDLQLFSFGRTDVDRAAWRRAVPKFEATARRHPDIGKAWFNLGYARLRARDASGSYTAFERALELEHRVPTTAYNLACAAAQMDDVETALRWLDRAEAEGMELASLAASDNDLDPLRSDPEFRRRLSRWRAEHQEKSQNKWFGKD